MTTATEKNHFLDFLSKKTGKEVFELYKMLGWYKQKMVRERESNNDISASHLVLLAKGLKIKPQVLIKLYIQFYAGHRDSDQKK